MATGIKSSESAKQAATPAGLAYLHKNGCFGQYMRCSFLSTLTLVEETDDGMINASGKNVWIIFDLIAPDSVFGCARNYSTKICIWELGWMIYFCICLDLILRWTLWFSNQLE